MNTLFDNTVTPRYGVYFRPRGGRWRLLAHRDSQALAHEMMLRLMDTRRGSGDWRVGRLEPTRGHPAASLKTS